MAYRSRARRSRRTNRRKRAKHARRRKPRTQKQLVSLIKKVALSTQETKIFTETYVPYNQVAPPTTGFIGQYSIVLRPPYMQIPNLKNVATKTEASFIGDQIHMRGFKFELFWNRKETNPTDIITTPTTIRLTLLSVAEDSDLINPIGFQQTPSNWYEPRYGSWPASTIWPVTMIPFNKDRVRVLKQRRYHLNIRDMNAASKHITFWCPVKGKRTRYNEEVQPGTNYFGQFSGRDYYVVMDMWNAAAEPVELDSTLVAMATAYFKDA